MGAAAGSTATAQSSGPVSVKVGVLNDSSGICADFSGEGAVVAARMAAENFRAEREGWRSRAAYKLLEIDDKYRVLKPG